jgi:hypothetical protein
MFMVLRGHSQICSSLCCFLAQVMMKDLVTPIPPDEIYGVVKKCLENAALMNYTKVTEMAKTEGNHTSQFSNLQQCN